MKKKIYIIEDEEDSRRLIESILSRNGYEIIKDGNEKFADREKMIQADLIILDVNLGIKRGDELCKELKRDKTIGHIPVILVSAMSELHGIAIECGADSHLLKPFTRSELLRKVRSTLSG
ncbi:MAG: response regulator [Bacteroidota bacterium]